MTGGKKYNHTHVFMLCKFVFHFSKRTLADRQIVRSGMISQDRWLDLESTELRKMFQENHLTPSLGKRDKEVHGIVEQVAG